eukprot:TRINITY_DN74052_c0_g1_i1.p1 TRINITY_DN74052_c0_g1~~TRINITY_DN74052_c0_g1_i1.p1  ORF type:complete len:975 (+),score=123.84 TRINITY_DN74052_c0_g1_i1:137-3061(+)
MESELGSQQARTGGYQSGTSELSAPLATPTVRCVFCIAVELESDVLARDPPEFRVEWGLADEDQSAPTNIFQGSWQLVHLSAKERAQGHGGRMLLGKLPQGQRILVRIRDHASASLWVPVVLRSIPQGHKELACGQCESFVKDTVTSEGLDSLRCVLCGQRELAHTAARKSAANPSQKTEGSGKMPPVSSPPLRGDSSRSVTTRATFQMRHDTFADPPPLKPGLRTAVLGDLEFVTNFDTSNGELLLGAKDAPPKKQADHLERYHVVVRPDPQDGVFSNQRKRWFHFGVRAAPGVPAERLRGKKIRIVVNNMSDMTDLFNLDGHRPWFRHVPHVPGWHKIHDLARPVCRYEDGGGRGVGVGQTGKFTVGMEEEPVRPKSSDIDESISKAQVRKALGIKKDDAIAVSEASKNKKPSKTCYVAFDFRWEEVTGTTYFAFAPAYGYADLEEHLERLDSFLASSPRPGLELPAYIPDPRAGAPWSEESPWKPQVGAAVYFHQQSLCVTPQGRSVKLLTVTAQDDLEHQHRIPVEVPPLCIRTSCFTTGGETPAKLFATRRIIFISARVHPGETPGQFACFGFINFILSNDPRAELLRQSFVFKIVPMLNPDGVALGHTRANSLGIDLNRCYTDPNPREHEGVFYSLQWLVHWAREGRLLFHLDMHAHAHTRGCVLYGNALEDVAHVWNVAFAHICQLNGPHFDMEGCQFPPKSDLEHGHGSTDNSSRARVASTCKLYHAYTLECHYSIGRLIRPVKECPGLEGRAVHPGIGVKTFKPIPYGVQEWESIGEAIAVSILDLHGCNPYSRIPLERQGSLENILDGVAKSLRLGFAFGAGDTLPFEREVCPETQVRLFRVLHEQVVARDGPAVTKQVLDMYARGSLVAVQELPESSWVKVVAPDGFLGGKAGTRIPPVDDRNVAREAYMLIDGSQKGLGMLLEPTDMWACLENDVGVTQVHDAMQRIPSKQQVQARALSQAG